MDTCIFCGAGAAVNLGTVRASCNLCHNFVFSDGETTHQAFRLGALMAARVNATSDLVREMARQAEQRRRTLGFLE